MSVIGEPINRVDGKKKVMGRAPYSAETPLKNVVHAVMVTSTACKGTVKSIDTRAAERSPGVLLVLTHQNMERMPAADKAQPADPKARAAGRVLNVFQDDRVHYSNQPIALVVAETLEQATHAADSLRVEYNVEPHETDLDKNRGKAFTPQTAGPASKAAEDVNNPDQEMAAATQTFEGEYRTAPNVHNPMELHATIASWENGKLTLYDSTQGIFGCRSRVAEVMGMPKENVHVVCYFVGGGFGCKGPTWSHVVLASVASKRLNRPVKLMLTRRQMFFPTGHRGETIQHMKLGANDDGRLRCVQLDGFGGTSDFDIRIENIGALQRMLYATNAIRVNLKAVHLNIGTPSYQRAPGECEGSFSMESSIDELAWKLKVDPLDLRLRNYTDKDPGAGKPFSSKSLRECYKVAAEKFAWSKRSPEPRSMRDGDILVGYGMATASYPTHVSSASALARLQKDGSILVQAGSQDLGTGTYTVMTQIAADTLGVPAERVTFELGDTDMPETPVSGGSQTAATVGSAVLLACRNLRGTIASTVVGDARSPLHGQAPDQLDFSNGKVFAKGASDGGESLSAVAQRSGQLEGRADAKPPADARSYSMHAFGAHFVEVRVDPDFGTIRVSRVVTAIAAGRILNRKTATSQILGGVVMGVGQALTEELVMDHRRGRLVNMDLAEYHVPVNADIPNIDVLWVDEDDTKVNPVGAKGVGEIGIVGVAAAVANAVYHATGVRVRDLPITLDKVLKGQAA